MSLTYVGRIDWSCILIVNRGIDDCGLIIRVCEVRVEGPVLLPVGVVERVVAESAANYLHTQNAVSRPRVLHAFQTVHRLFGEDAMDVYQHRQQGNGLQTNIRYYSVETQDSPKTCFRISIYTFIIIILFTHYVSSPLGKQS